MPILQCFNGGVAAANLIYACVQPAQVHLANAAGTVDYELFPGVTYIIGGTASAIYNAAPTGTFVPFAVQVGIPGGQT